MRILSYTVVGGAEYFSDSTKLGTVLAYTMTKGLAVLTLMKNLQPAHTECEVVYWCQACLAHWLKVRSAYSGTPGYSDPFVAQLGCRTGAEYKEGGAEINEKA